MESNKHSTFMEFENAAGPIFVPEPKAASGSLPSKPKFEPLKAHEMSEGRVQFRKVSVPAHRYTPLKKAWMEIYTPIYEQMKIDIRMNLKARKVELKTRSDTPDISSLQKCADFVHAFMLGFDVIDAVALLRLDELYVDSFEIKDVKTLKNEHLSRAIGRLFGKGGKTKFAVENATRTQIVIADEGNMFTYVRQKEGLGRRRGIGRRGTRRRGGDAMGMRVFVLLLVLFLMEEIQQNRALAVGHLGFISYNILYIRHRGHPTASSTLQDVRD